VLEIVRALEGGPYALTVACPRASTLWRELDGTVPLREISPARRASPGDVRSLASLVGLVAAHDVVHAHSSKAGFLARLACGVRGRGSRCVFTPHGWSFWAVDGAERALYLRLERMAARWCRAIVALSEDERQAGLAAGVGSPAVYRVIPNGVDLQRFAANPAPVAGRIVMVGRFAAPKRHDLVVRAFAELRRQHPGAELHLVGDGPLRGETDELAVRLGLRDAVRFLGSRDDVPDLLASAAIVVLASDYEALPLSVIEAMAAGVPVVATRTGGIRELVADGTTGVLVDTGDVRALAAGLGALLDDPDRARTLGARARADARQRFSRERMVAALLALYDEAARAR
jgi:glycosyltransferase involved in cell wall biosynthesis